MKARCAMMEEAMAPCDALAGVRFRCESGAVRCGAVRCRVVRWDGKWNRVCDKFKEAGR